MSRILLAVLAVLVLGLSLIPRSDPFRGSFGAYDKVGHFAAYLVLGFFATRAVDRTNALPLVMTIAGCTIFGGIIEIVQPFVGRSMELADFIVDLAGSTAGAAVAALLMRRASIGGERGSREGRSGA